jgi:hypothetical protein
MYVINKTVISNTEPENKYVFWYYPKTGRIYMYNEDGWQPLDKLGEELTSKKVNTKSVKWEDDIYSR